MNILTTVGCGIISCFDLPQTKFVSVGMLWLQGKEYWIKSDYNSRSLLIKLKQQKFQGWEFQQVNNAELRVGLSHFSLIPVTIIGWLSQHHTQHLHVSESKGCKTAAGASLWASPYQESISKMNPTSPFPKMDFSSAVLGQDRIISKALPAKEIGKLVSRISASIVGGKLRTKKEEGMEKGCWPGSHSTFWMKRKIQSSHLWLLISWGFDRGRKIENKAFPMSIYFLRQLFHNFCFPWSSKSLFLLHYSQSMALVLIWIKD